MEEPPFVPGYDTCDEITPQCPVEATLYGDYFTKGPIIFFVVAYALLLAYQIWFGFKSRAWGFFIWLGVGTAFELAGYAARLKMIDKPWEDGPFQLQLLLLILGPTLIAAAIAVTFKHVVLYYGPELSVLRPRWYPFVFVGTDIVAILVQGAGAVMAGAENGNMDASSGLLIGGVSFQLVNMIGCGLIMVVYWRRYRSWKNTSTRTRREEEILEAVRTGNTEYRKVRWFVRFIVVAYVCIIVRCIYRVPEMALGWGSSLMQDETLFLILDGAMILLAVSILCAFHPGLFFPRLGKAKEMDGLTPAQLMSQTRQRKPDGPSFELQ